MRLTKIETTARSRMTVEHAVENGRGVTKIAVEICDQVDTWRAVKTIEIGNASLFLVRDALDRACELAMREPR